MKIVILDAYAANPGDLSWDEFAALGELTVYDRTAQEDAAARIGDAEVVFINKVRLTDEIFAACPNLKLVSILATGYNIVDLAAAKRRGITVCNVPGYSTRAVVQMTFALLLEICQQVGLHSGAVHTAPSGPRNDKSGSIAPLNSCHQYCQPAWRSLSAATDAIGRCVFIDTLHELEVPSRDCHVALLLAMTI